MGIVKRISLPLVIIVICLIIILSVLNIKGSFDPPLLLPILNTLFMGVLLIIVAVYAAKSYLKIYNISYLFMCAAFLVTGFGAILAGWLRFLPDGTNLNVSIYVSCIFGGAVFHFLAAMREDRKEKNQKFLQAIKAKLLMAIFGVYIFIALIVLAVLLKIMPLFYDQNSFTILRQTVLQAAIILIFSASMVLVKNYRRQKTDFIYWYSFSLIMMTIGLFGNTFIQVIGGYASWLARLTQYLGSFFALLSILSAIKETRNRTTSFAGIMADFFADREAIYKTMVETSNNAIVSVDQEFHVLYINPAAEKMFHIKHAHALNTSFIDQYIQDCDKKLLQDDFKNFRDTGASALAGKTTEIAVRDCEGRVFSAEISSAMRLLPTGWISTYIIHDISYRKEAQADIAFKNTILSAINQIYEKAVISETQEELGRTCLHIVESVTNSAFSFINELKEDGRLHELVISEPGWILCNLYDKTGHQRKPGSFDVLGLYGSVIEEGKSLLTNDPSNHPKSSGIPEGHPRLTAFLGVPFIRAGKVGGIVAVGNREGGYSEINRKVLEAIVPAIFEVLLRKRAEEALKESDRLLHAVIDNAADPVFLKDRQCRMLLANEATARMVGAPIAEMLGKTAMDYYRKKENAVANLENDRRIMDTDRAEVIEEYLYTGVETRIFLSAKTPWHDAQGNIIGLIGIARDITDRIKMENELKRTAAELEQKNKLITEFFINLSHEFKTPIAILMLALEMMEHYQKQKELNRSGIIKHTAIMKQNAFRLSRLVNNLLDVTKIDAGFMTPKLENMDIVCLLGDIVESLKSFTNKRGLRIKFLSSVKTKFMAADSQMIERIILNLVSNAIKHTEKGGLINVYCKDLGGKAMISVKDNGEGIPHDKRDIIFDRFRQVNTSLTRSSEGCGIGLALTKALVGILGGRIWFESTLGKGSEFFIELPVLQVDEEQRFVEQNGLPMDKRIQMEFSDIDFS